MLSIETSISNDGQEPLIVTPVEPVYTQLICLDEKRVGKMRWFNLLLLFRTEIEERTREPQTICLIFNIKKCDYEGMCLQQISIYQNN